jgi:hypothetical protein
MLYKEVQYNLFDIPSGYYLAHCISADFKLGKGIAVDFDRIYNMRERLQDNYPYYHENWVKENMIGDCIQVDNVFNLVTKEVYWSKPTYQSITVALTRMKEYCIQNNIWYIAMPKIGCGLDRLAWDKVSEIIKKLFVDTPATIIVCYK